MVTSCAPLLSNYMCVFISFHIDNCRMYTGDEGVYTYTFELERKPDCPVCGTQAAKITMKQDAKLADLIETLAERQELYALMKNTDCAACSRSRVCERQKRRFICVRRRRLRKLRDPIWRKS
jgi:hypothetical protein